MANRSTQPKKSPSKKKARPAEDGEAAGWRSRFSKWVVGLVGAAVAAILVGGLASGLGKEAYCLLPGRCDSNLKLVEVRITEAADGDSQADILLRNTGDKTAFAKEVRFVLRKEWSIPAHCYCYFEPPSWTYEIEDPSFSGSPFPISQSVPAGEVDRFIIDLPSVSIEPAQWPQLGDLHILLVEMSVVYDEDDKSISSDLLLYVDHEASGGSAPAEFIEEDCFVDFALIDAVRELTSIETIKDKGIVEFLDRFHEVCEYMGTPTS